MTGRLQAPSSYYSVPREEILRVVNGCGPGKWKFDFVPDKLLGNDFTEACNIHDWRYYIGGTESDRLVADLELFSNMVIICANDDACGLNAAEVAVCLEYFMAVRRFGKKHFGVQ